MRLLILFAVLFPFGQSSITTNKELEVKQSPYYKDGVMNYNISREAGMELFQHWIDQAFSGLMAAVATKKLPTVSTAAQNTHQTCAESAKTVQDHAKCVVVLLDSKRKSLRRQTRIGSFRNSSVVEDHFDKYNEWVGGFRTARRKRAIVKRSKYNLIGAMDRSPVSLLAKHLTNTIRTLKNKKEHKNWQTIVEEVRTQAKEVAKRKKAEKAIKKRMQIFQDAADKMKAKLGNIDHKLLKQRPLGMKDLDNAEELLEETDAKELFRLAKEKKKKMKLEDDPLAIPVDIMREAVKLGMAISGRNVTNFDMKNVKMISPRIMSIVPEDDNANETEISLLSPSLFSLHGDGKGIEKATSLLNLLNNTRIPEIAGFKGTEQQDWMDFIVETSGVGDAIEQAKASEDKKISSRDSVMNARGIDGQPLFFNKENVTKIYGEGEKKKIEIFEQLEKIVTKEQMERMNHTGFTVMTPEQLQLVYGKSSPFNSPKHIKLGKNISDAEVERNVRSTVRDIATGKAKFEARQNDIVLSPIVGSLIQNAPTVASQPIILSPVLLSSLVGSPAVFGVVLLSPWVFVPIIVSPRVLSPVILSPFLFAPIILSPLVLDPVILSPGIFLPVILSPFVLSPFILSPQAFTPIILSPFALSPFIGTPNLLSPVILSPFVLSPIIFSPPTLSALILSPYALSPSMNSTPMGITIFASPSWLS